MNLPPHLLRELPGLETVFDADAMREHLQAALFGAPGSGWRLERCEPDRPLFLAGEGATLQFDCEVRDTASGSTCEPIVVGRVFPDRESCAAYMRQKLAPLMERVRGRTDLTLFAKPAALIEPLHMVVHVWPIDGELPTLVDATDPRHMIAVLREVLATRLVIEDLRIELVSYRRRSRCVLRYVLSGRAHGTGEPCRLVLYGKLTPRGDELLYGETLARLRAHFEARRNGPAVTIPRSLGWRPELGLALLEEVAGEAKLGTALRARLRAKAPGDGPSLELMLSACVRVATSLHGSGLPLGRSRPLEDRLADLAHEVEITRLFSPEYAERARDWLSRVSAQAQDLEAEPFRLCHGDFKYAQLLFDGEAVGLVDLDNLCQAEPAIDLGQFFAYLRAQARMSKRADSVSPTLEDELCERFLDEYASAMRLGAEALGRLRTRATLHEVASLMRMALHSAQKLKLERLESSTALLEERLATLG